MSFEQFNTMSSEQTCAQKLKEAWRKALSKTCAPSISNQQLRLRIAWKVGAAASKALHEQAEGPQVTDAAAKPQGNGGAATRYC